MLFLRHEEDKNTWLRYVHSCSFVSESKGKHMVTFKLYMARRPKMWLFSKDTKRALQRYSQFKAAPDEQCCSGIENTQKIYQDNVSLLAGIFLREIFLCEYRIIPGLLCHTCSELPCIPRVSYSLNTRLTAEGVYTLKAGITESTDKTAGGKVIKMGFVSLLAGMLQSSEFNCSCNFPIGSMAKICFRTHGWKKTQSLFLFFCSLVFLPSPCGEQGELALRCTWDWAGGTAPKISFLQLQ